MAIKLNLPAEVITDIFSKAHDLSAVALLSRKANVLNPRNQMIYDFSSADAAWHAPGGANKGPGEDTLAQKIVPVSCIYKVLEFDDTEFDDTVGTQIIDQVVEQLPAIIAESFDKSVFGNTIVPTSPLAGFTETPASVDDTAASWIAAHDAVVAEGYSPDGWILDKSMASLVRNAFTEGSMTNPLSFGVKDGFSIAGIPAYFRDLGGMGVVGDFGHQSVVATWRGLDVKLYSPDDDYSRGLANGYAVIAKAYMGQAVANQEAFKPLVAGAGA